MTPEERKDVIRMFDSFSSVAQDTIDNMEKSSKLIINEHNIEANKIFDKYMEKVKDIVRNYVDQRLTKIEARLWNLERKA